MKQFKKAQSLKKRQSTKNNIVKQIQKLQQQINNTNEDIKKTQKMLDIDLFLKQQKQKRLQYAKQINTDYQAQKKIRQQKLYKKFKRQERQQQKQSFKQSTKQIPNQTQTQKEKIPNNQRIQFKIQNIPVLNPILIIKSLLNQRIQDQWVKDGHHYKPSDINLQGLRQSQSNMFVNYYKNPNEKPKYDGDKQSQHIVWKNIKQVAQNPLELVTIPKQIPENSLIPNDYHSENILGALTLITPQISAQTFAQNDKIFMAELFSPNAQITVVVDKMLLVRQFPHKYVNMGSRSENKNILWPTLIQKCIQKLKICKGIKHLTNSINKCIYTIYGLDPEIIGITNKNVIKQNFYLVLGHLLQEGAVGFLNINGHSKKAYQNRLYVLQQVKEHIQKQGVKQKKQIKFKIKNPWRGNLIDNQNVNRFNLLELLQLFNCLVLLRDYPSKWSCLRINVNYFSNGGVSMTSNQWTKNPQYLFTITKPTYTRVVLRKSGQLGDKKQGVYGFLLFQNKQSINKIQALKMDWLITKTKSVDMNQATFTTKLKKGNYVLIPYCTQQSSKQYQFYVMDIFVEKQSNIQFGKARFFDYNYVQKKGSRLNNPNTQKIIQTLQSTQRFQKPRVQKIDIPTQYKKKLDQKIIQNLNLNLYNNVSAAQFFIPGLVSNLLINKSVQLEVELKQPNKQTAGKQKQLQGHKMNQQVAQHEQAQNLQILLGYDALDDDIDQGFMAECLEQSVGVYDFRDYGLGQEGLTGLLEGLSLYPQIIQIDLSGNELNDFAITFLCYSMQKGNRTQLRKINIERNRFGKIGRNALVGLKSTFPKLEIVGIE